MRETRTYGSVRGASSNGRPYRDLIFALPYALKLLGTKIERLILSEAVARSRGLWTRGSPNGQYCFFVGTSRIHQAGI